MHQLIAAPFMGKYLVLRPGESGGITIPKADFLRLTALGGDAPTPSWLVDAAARQFGIDLAGAPLDPTVLIRQPSMYGYVRASYELNLGCNYDCEHCYLAQKRFEGLDWPERARLLSIMRDAGVVFIQLTGGEPMIDRLFTETYERAFALGMMISVSSNGSRLSDPRILAMLKRLRPYRITLSVYGATEESYDKLTKRHGAYRRFIAGLEAGVEAGLPIKLNNIVTSTNDHEVAAMEDLARSFGLPFHTFVNMSPTIYGGGEPLQVQSTEYLRKREPFKGCNAGHTFFHSDPFGRASICKIGRDDAISLMTEGLLGLTRLKEVADRLMLRTGGCSGCALSGTCWTCRPLAKQYQESKAPLGMYCQHGEPRGGE
ncbi:radical SAM protein [Glycomyces artemisiae]|uniref:MoaA/NifB/PqqE/SkfB family radical SAM enzyme n=1 Tax=Glycomyces artemisiae TaxID=1076443 RepID=A0A2T0UDJ8_9ACTN|nr:radical SAM protein [Glycomyces artemisiae]PRY56016.1 MoaA/NifB/PqqE/SkfB family radical SAM enzyme [Glycomyces artemisiae]